MHPGSSINLPATDYKPTQSDSYRSKLKDFIRRFGRHSTEHRNIIHLEDSRGSRSSVSLAKSSSSHGVETFDDDDMAWSRPSSRATTSRPSMRTRLRATTSQGPAETLDDENNAWTRPPTGRLQLRSG